MANVLGTGTPGSVAIPGQLIPDFWGNAFAPSTAQAPSLTGGLRVRPTLAYPTGLGVGVPGNFSSDMQAANAASQPFSVSQSPVIMMVVFLLASVVGLRMIHFRAIDG